MALPRISGANEGSGAWVLWRAAEGAGSVQLGEKEAHGVSSCMSGKGYYLYKIDNLMLAFDAITEKQL